MSRQLGIELKRSKYRLLGLVGQGQFGRVFCAVHRQTGQFVALKELEQQRFPTHKFLRELRFLLSLQHPNIVTCQALEHTATGRCLVMDYCEAGTLRSLMTEENHLSLPHSIKLIADILAGLEHAHSRDIVHCDIKPENILLNIEPAGWTARISDFGVARLSQELSNQEFGNTGSPAYMAPERFYGQYSQTSDLYAVGVLLFELMVGQRPFSGTPEKLMSAHLNQPVKIPDTVPEIWRPLIITALQKLSARRFRTAGEMLAMLRSIAASSEFSMALEGSSLPLPLFRSPVILTTPFQAQHQEVLRQPIVTLAAQIPPSAADSPPHPFSLYRAEAQQVILHRHETGTVDPVDPARSSVFQIPEATRHTLSYPTSIESLLLRPQGCFVVTRRCLYLISPTDIDTSFTSQPILELEHDYRAAIDDRGRWLATLTAASDTEGTLTVRQLTDVAAPARSISVNLQSCSITGTQITALDDRHVAVVHTPTTRGTGKSELVKSLDRSLIRVFTRKGVQVGTLHLPVQVGKFIRTLLPYQLLAVDGNNSRSVLLIDLKPYRILRLGVEIEPAFLLATHWGYLIASAEGKIACLDRELRPIGQLLAPSSITAMVAIEPYELLIATWDGQQGYLHSLDLRESGLDLLF